MTIPEKFKHWLSETIDGHVLGLFRLVFGSFMVYNTYSYYRLGLIESGLLAPRILFKFEGFGWLHPLPEPFMLAIMALMGLSALLIAAGVLFRWACWGFALSLSFFLFQEKSYFNNHIYLFVLLGVLLSFTNADHFISLRRGRRFDAVPRWQQFILQAQVMIVYFYGGITKLKPDWLINREPVASMSSIFPAGHWLAPVFKSDAMVNVLTYGGFLLDILAPILLWYKPVRRWALPVFIGFHLSNSRIFNDIGIFPFLMLSALILYFETEEVPFLRRLSKAGAATSSGFWPETGIVTRNALIVYFAFQLLFPFRGFFLPNPMDWTGIGKNF
nr:HTTM domain-containing protein [Saprospiraceae bacterium]